MTDKIYRFNYICSFKINKSKDDIEIISYNSPYEMKQDKQSIDDIRYAILEQKVIDIKNYIPNKRYDIKIECIFIEREVEKVYDQIFKLESLEVI